MHPKCVILWMVGATDVAPLSVMIFARLDEMGKNYQMNDDVVRRSQCLGFLPANRRGSNRSVGV